ncbi:MAG TPA: DUF3617 family protein [Spirochaetota bacterium]|nr:DUF3617 family protein [Spirochaetota bacterium]HPI88955.1 DUF3617 family protein [Spirochaetota bacterium]HPR46568.1 DUF3617 family protein [Spirochaetota bacterium]
MKKLYSLALTFLIVAGLSVLGMSAVNMQEGNWEITTTTDVQGVPYPMPPVTYTQCLTKKDLNPQKTEKGQECKEVSSKVQGNTYSWVIECRSMDTVTRSSGKITYRGTTFSGTVTTTTEGMVMKQTIRGRRLGPCK